MLDCDASDYGIGAVLSQQVDGEEKVIAYGSRLFSAAELKYCITRKELLAVVHFTKVFRQYLLGNRFVLRTDHAALQWLQKTPEPIGQQGRWLERLSEFDFEIVHRPGRRHGNADALSRRSCRQCGELFESDEAVLAREVTEARTPTAPDSDETIASAQRADKDLSIVRSWLVNETGTPSLIEILSEGERVKVYWHQRESISLREDVLIRRTPGGIEQVLVPRALQSDFLRLAHTGLTGGHLGVRRTRWQVRRRAYWPGWSKDVRRYCRQCDACCQYHRGKTPRQGTLQPIPSGEPWERLSLDITGPHPRSKRGHIYILTVMDHFSKFVEAIPLANQEAVSVAKALVETVVVRYGAPLQILTDQGRNFEGNLFHEICRYLEIDKVRTTPYRPQCNGMIERFHRTLNAMIGKVILEHQRNWDEVLPYVVSAYRASVHEATGYTPNFLIFGRENRAPLDLVYGRPEETDAAPKPYAAYVNEWCERMEKAYTLVRGHLKHAAERRRHSYDLRVRPKQFKAGDLVWYFTPRRFKGRTPKWQRFYTGPFTILEPRGAVNYLVRRSPKAKPFLCTLTSCALVTIGQLSAWEGLRTRGDPVLSRTPKLSSRMVRPWSDHVAPLGSRPDTWTNAARWRIAALGKWQCAH